MWYFNKIASPLYFWPLFGAVLMSVFIRKGGKVFGQLKERQKGELSDINKV